MTPAMQILLCLGSKAPPKTYIEDVFSAYTYTGTGASQTITTGIDLAGKGGLLWLKRRDLSGNHLLVDSGQGTAYSLSTNNTNAQNAFSNSNDVAFTSTGWQFNNNYSGNGNVSTATQIAWTFAKKAKFFDIVTWTGNGASSKTLTHALNATPGMIIVKSPSQASQWYVWWNTGSDGAYTFLNSTGAPSAGSTDRTIWGNGSAYVAPTSTQFTVGSSMNANTQTYVAYVFGHDTTSDGLIQCGTWTGNGSHPQSISLGWEPQFMLVLPGGSGCNVVQRNIYDMTRGVPAGASSVPELSANSSAAESTGGGIDFKATGFNLTSANYNASTQVYIYMAIRRGPMKAPTSGTQVYKGVLHTATGATASITGVGFPPDLVFTRDRGSSALDCSWFDRLRGPLMEIGSNSTAAEASQSASLTSFDMDGFTVGADGSLTVNGDTGVSYIHWCLRRYPGVFDEVCYTGTGSTHTEAHNLGVAPELIIVKRRSSTANWLVRPPTGSTDYLMLSSTSNIGTDSTMWNNTAPTSSAFTVGTYSLCNSNGGLFVAYLFATLAGVSKVGTYTGNGSSQTINCGFAAGARFVLIKSLTDSGDWYVWDSTRGIVSGNDPHLSLNTMVGETTTDDSIDPDSSGFIVNQLSATNININAKTYMFFAIS